MAEPEAETGKMPRWVLWALGGVALVIVIVLVMNRLNGSSAASAPSQQPQSTPAGTVSPADDLALTDYADQQMGNWQTVLAALEAQNQGTTNTTTNVALPGAGSGTVPGGTAASPS